MTISRGQMERQLRMGGGIMDVVPRDKALLGGIKKAVKKVGKTVKKIAKSDIGKAALAGAALFGLGGAKFLGGEGIFKAGQGFQRFRNFANLPAALGFGKTAAAPVSMSDAMLNSVNTGLAKDTVAKKFLGDGVLTKGLALAGLSTFLMAFLIPPNIAGSLGTISMMPPPIRNCLSICPLDIVII